MLSWRRLAAIRGHEWVAGIGDGLTVVKVSVADVRVEHEVKLMDFTKWLDRTFATRGERTSTHSVDPGDAGFRMRRQACVCLRFRKPHQNTTCKQLIQRAI
jgi:hypothetical protein